MSYRVLIAVESCHLHRGLQQAQRETWFGDICATDKRFFLGGPTTVGNEDEVFLDVDDSYNGLPYKTRAVCKWAVEHDFDFTFKCDTDTLFNPWNWFDFDKRLDYLGGENADAVSFSNEPVQFASGGAGYWLSRKAMEIVAAAKIPQTTAEDVFVASALKDAGISPVWHSGYRWRPGADIDKDVVSLHLSSAYQKKYKPEMMHEVYAKLKDLQ